MKVISHVHLWSLTIGRQARSCTNCTPVAKCYRIASNVKICWSPVLVVIWILANWFPFRELKLKYVEVRRMNCWPYKFTSNSLTNHTLQKKTTHRPRGILLPTKNPYTESKKNNRHLYIYIYTHSGGFAAMWTRREWFSSGKAFHSETVLESWGRAWRSTSRLYRSAIWPCGYRACHLGNGDF